MPHFTNTDGTTQQSFQIGIGGKSAKMTIEEDHLVVSIPLQVTNRDGSEFVPKLDNDVVPYATFIRYLNRTFTETKQYITEMLRQLQESGKFDPETGEFHGEMGNIMPDPIYIDWEYLKDGEKVKVAVVPRTKFISQICIELEEQFQDETGAPFEMAIGTEEDPAYFVDWFCLTDLDHSVVVNVLKTMNVDTEIFATMRIPNGAFKPLPEYVPTLHPYRDRVAGNIRTDASGRVITVTLQSDNIRADTINRPDLFPNAPAGYLDFGINLPLEYGKRYRIRQLNECLSIYPQDSNIKKTNEGWVKEAIYTKEEEDTDEVIYYFLQTQSKGESDYSHIWIYDADLDDDENNVALYAFHIKNELAMMPEEELDPEAYHVSIDFLSEEEAVCRPFSYVAEPGRIISAYTLAGEVHDISSTIDSDVKPPDTPLTALRVTIHGMEEDKPWTFSVINPVYERLVAFPQILEDDLGRRYTKGEITGTGTCSFLVLVGPDRDYTLNINLRCEGLTYAVSYVFDNRLKFINEPLIYRETEIARLANSLSFGNKGSMWIRILTF